MVRVRAGVRARVRGSSRGWYDLVRVLDGRVEGARQQGVARPLRLIKNRLGCDGAWRGVGSGAVKGDRGGGDGIGARG